MSWLDQTLDMLEQSARGGAVSYMAGGEPAAEPTALAALAFLQSGRNEAAQKAADALAAMQQSNGEVGVRRGETPGWPTSFAIVTWTALNSKIFEDRIDRAVQWLLANRGQAVERSENFGHNTELVGWAYAEQTHSWAEPTAFAVLALKAAGRGNDPAAREGIAVLIDRQLPGGGLNYGNTYVLGQLIRPHIQPTGIGLLALAGESDSSNRIAKTIAWLGRSIGPETTPLSLGWSLLGLRPHGALPPEADGWLAGAAARVQSRDRSPHKLALVALAAKGWPT